MGDTQENGTASLLASALVTHAVPEYTPAQPDRVLLDVGTLPTLDKITFDSGTYPSGQPYLYQHFSAHHPDGSAACPGPGHLSPGRDTLLLLNAWGEDAVLYYTGMDRQSEPTQREAYRVPAGLLPQVRKALGYPEEEPLEG